MNTPSKKLSFIIVALLLMGLSPWANAEGKIVAQLDGRWQEHPAGEVAYALATRDQIYLEHPKRWSAQEVLDFKVGVDATPEFLRQGSGFVRVERVRRTCLYGVGRYNQTCPTFDPDQQTFYLYDVPPLQGEGSTRKLKTLLASERVSLQRQRAAVHMLLARYDQKHQWSMRKKWRLINTWDSSGTKPFNVDDWAFSRYLGSRSTHLDLVTFAEEFFIRPEDILASSKAPDAKQRLEALDVNLSLDCQEFTKQRILKDFISEHDRRWSMPARKSALGCPEFERWADMNSAEGIDLLLAAATSDRPESLYGHLLLAVRYKSATSVRSQGFEPVYQYGAVTDSDVDKIDYFTKGLFGGFYAVIQPNTFRGIDRLFLQYEQRTLRRYALNLSPKELRQALERIWEAERHITYPYYFLSDNCASMLIDLLAPALDSELPEPIRAGLMPTEVLDVFAQVQVKERGPLLVKRAETHFSSREVAMSAVPERRQKLAALKGALKGVDEAALERLQALDGELDERDAERRLKAYQELQEHLTKQLKAYALANPKAPMLGKGSVTRQAIDYLYYSTRIERYFMDLAFYRKRVLAVAAHKEPFRMTAEQQLQMRRELFQEEDIMARQEAVLAWARQSDERVREAPSREFNEEEKAEIKRLDLTRDAYLGALDALATIIERFEPDLDGVGYINDKLQTFELAQTRRDQLAMGPPGKGRYIIGAAMAQTGDTDNLSSAAWLDLSASLVHERLGEQRRRGFRPDIESRALGIDAELRLDGQLLDELKLDAILFRFLTIEQRMGPVQRSWRDLFGWGVDVRIAHDGRRDLDVGLHAKLGYLYPIWQHDNVSSFLVTGLLLDFRSDWGNSRDPDLVGLNAFLMGQWHMYGRYANVMRASVQTSQLAALDELGYDWDMSAELSTEHVLADINQQLLLLRPYARLEWSSLQYRPGQDDFLGWRAGLAIELPF